MLKLEIQKKEGILVPDDLSLEQWLSETIKKIHELSLENGFIELNFVDSDQIRTLNNKFRDIDKETDVLSFSFIGEKEFPGDNMVGQIFIAPEIAKKQASSHNASWKDELEFLFVHALLHIAGFDHENRTDFKHMFDLQVQIMPDPKWQFFVDQIFQKSFGKP
jgi:probable rRNA maturation factor